MIDREKGDELPIFSPRETNKNEPKLDSNRSQISEQDEDVLEKYEHIVLGHIKVPLISLITKNNGIDGEFHILDDYKQSMGTLKMKIQLNHHSQQRPLYSGTSKVGQPAPELKGRTTIIDKSLNQRTR